MVFAAAVFALIVQSPRYSVDGRIRDGFCDESTDAADSSLQTSGGSKPSSAGLATSSSSGGISFPGVSLLAVPSGDPDASSDLSNEGALLLPKSLGAIPNRERAGSRISLLFF